MADPACPPLPRDRVGLGWRDALAASILANLGAIDVLEVVADDWFDAPPARLRVLEHLARTVPLWLHGTTLGCASAAPVDGLRLDRMARLVAAVQPAGWSEHLAFVRGGGLEIGHLAAPPRSGATIDGCLRNVRRVRSVVGSAPLLENVATLIEPPGSDYDEISWINQFLSGNQADMLLDLHNLHANSINFRFDARQFLRQLPRHRVAMIHLAGGRYIGPATGPRLLDDHLHDVPDEVFDLLEYFASLDPPPLTVIIERDGKYPPMSVLIDQLARARQALTRGRARAA